jgi:AcrR family transcriptional regulator
MIRKARGLSRDVTSPAIRRSAAQRRARERTQRSADVLEAARRLFIRRGYGGTTMADIAGGSGFAVGTLYELFPSKEAMLRRLLEDRIDRLLDRLREVAAPLAGDPRRQIGQIVRTHLGFFQEDPVLLRLTLSAWSGSDFTVRRDLGERMDKKHRAYLALLVPVFERGIRAGVFARRPPVRLAIALTGVLNSLIRRWVREPRLDLLGEGTALIEIFFYGITRRSRQAQPGGAR